MPRPKLAFQHQHRRVHREIRDHLHKRKHANQNVRRRPRQSARLDLRRVSRSTNIQSGDQVQNSRRKVNRAGQSLREHHQHANVEQKERR